MIEEGAHRVIALLPPFSQASPALFLQVSPAQASPAQVSPTQASPAQASPVQVSLAEASPVQACLLCDPLLLFSFQSFQSLVLALSLSP